jgi:20S proteasome alpha/beta subunit
MAILGVGIHAMNDIFGCVMVGINRFHTDPSGTFTKYAAKAIGAGSEGAQTALEEHYNKVFGSISSVLLCIDCHTASVSLVW